MADIEKILEVAVVAGKAITSDEHIQEFLFGTYSDGTKRNLSDAVHGEFLSPSQKQKATKKKKKKKNTKFKL